MIATDLAAVRTVLADLDRPCYVLRTATGVGLAAAPVDGAQTLAAVPPLPPERLGGGTFPAAHGVRYPYLAGAMANGIASEELVIELVRAGFLASFGAAGLLPERIEQALTRLDAGLPGRPYAANLIHSPAEPGLERAAVDAYLRHRVPVVEASAFMDLTAELVRYRVAGLGPGGPANRVIAKVSRLEVAELFLRPAPEPLLRALVADGAVTAEQADRARSVPLADDVTCEADSGGHTDRRPLPVLLPAVLALRDRLAPQVRVGAAGGLGTPVAIAAAFALGAQYVVTGSVNQACVESGTSDRARAALARAGVADCTMAPAADMFELGVELQVLQRGTMFPARARQLYELYRRYDGMDALPAADRERLEKQVFRRSLRDVWADCEEYFTRRDPSQLERAAGNPRRQLALVFRWYLGMASRWATVGDPDRIADYQIWCGPAMGAFNDWVAGTYLEEPGNRRVAEVALHLMRGAAQVRRVAALRDLGVGLPAAWTGYRPVPLAAELGVAA